MGEGKTVLFLHGFLSNKESFYYQTRELSKRFRTVAIDLAGFSNQPLEYPWSLDDYKNSVNEVIELLEVDKLHIVAHSFGARIALKLLPENKRIDKLILTGAAGLKPRFSLKKKAKIFLYKTLKHILPKDKLSSFGSSDYRALSETMQKSFVKIVNEHLDYRLPLIENDVLLIFGKNDTSTPLYMAKRFEKGLKHSLLCVLQDAGHFAFIDKVGEFNALAKDFLST